MIVRVGGHTQHRAFCQYSITARDWGCCCARPSLSHREKHTTHPQTKSKSDDVRPSVGKKFAIMGDSVSTHTVVALPGACRHGYIVQNLALDPFLLSLKTDMPILGARIECMTSCCRARAFCSSLPNQHSTTYSDKSCPL